jgi:MFS family permease
LPSGLFLGLIAACIFLPALIMCFVADWFCTKFGRKKVIYLGSVLIVIGAIFNALSQNAAHFMGCRSNS